MRASEIIWTLQLMEMLELSLDIRIKFRQNSNYRQEVALHAEMSPMQALELLELVTVVKLFKEGSNIIVLLWELFTQKIITNKKC